MVKHTLQYLSARWRENVFDHMLVSYDKIHVIDINVAVSVNSVLLHSCFSVSLDLLSKTEAFDENSFPDIQQVSNIISHYIRNT